MTTLSRHKAAIATHRARERKRLRTVIIFLAIMAASLVFDVATGPSMLSPMEVIRSLTGIGERAAMTDSIVRNLRLPMALMALAVGAALGAGGAQMQTLLNNPMASPYTLGMAAAAGFGAAFVLALGGLGLPVMIAVPVGGFCLLNVGSIVPVHAGIHATHECANHHSRRYRAALPVSVFAFANPIPILT
ncbi:iron chelate uptake ABC transporter family permease subunit [Brucella pseudogrignonensis]|nr:iron chelate uptake ABC transporter family permease subunit [Brucella pseudogrignonensis]MDT6940830.1 iron chelate uptake ABC transporter family permease subunit [Brucella pseudogrignonensis]